MRTRRAAGWGVGLVLVAVQVANGQFLRPHAQPQGRGAQPKAGEPEERIDQPPAPGPALRTSIPAVRLMPRGLAMTTQVNVNAQGLNIVGDAANEPSIAVDPTAPNRMAIGWRQFDSVQSNFREAGYAYSVDGGRTWTFPGVLQEGVFRSDPVLDSDNQGTFYYYSLDLNFLSQLFRSTDQGRTWQGPIAAFGGDKTWMVADRSGGPGESHIYGVWKPGIGCCGNNIFTRSSDTGFTFEQPVPILGNPIRGTIATGPESEVYVAGEAGSAFRVARSLTAREDGAQPTFPLSVVVNLGGVLGGYAGPYPGGVLAQAWVACDLSDGPHRGNVYLLCSVDPPTGDPLDVMFARSTDGGQTWSAPVRINDDASNTNAWQWFGTMSVAPNGRIDVIWNDTRTSGSNFRLSRLRYSSSSDGGVTWAPSQELSASWDAHVGWPQQQKIGDYYHMVSDRVGAFLAWSNTLNGEQDVYCTRIGDYDCNGNGVGDSADLTSGAASDCDMNGILDSCEIAAGVMADSDGDGIPDGCECRADFNGDNLVNSQDFFDFVAAFFAGEMRADFNGDAVVNSQDFFDFLAVFFGGC